MANEPTRTDITISGNVATWHISMTGDILGLVTGTFTFRCFLSPTQRLASSRDYRALLGENPASASQHDDDLAFALSQLKYRVLTSPPFWSSTLQHSSYQGDLGDDSVIMAVLQAAIDAELMFKTQAKKRREDALQKALGASDKALKEQAKEDEVEAKEEQ